MEGKKILIIEDSEIFRGILVDKLEKEGYKVSFLMSNTTINEIREQAPKLAIINITTPKEKGLKLIEEMSQDTELSAIPVVVIAKTGGSVLVDHARKYGVKYMIDRTIFDAEEMLENITYLLAILKREDVSVGEKEDKKTAKKTAPQTSNKGVILLVEDDVFMRELFAKNLREAGFEVYDVADAVIAEKALKDNMPDVILLDLLLPGKSGFQFLSELKRKEKYTHIPVVVVSNLGSKGDIDRALDLGAVDFLVKANATIDEIVMKAGEHIQKSKEAPKLPKSIMNEDLKDG
ncbi:MAG: response regulator [Candidatus Pacebacteria bacterium]|nr:response regulator [Candidatus Paceibacterota bacterium]